MKTDFRPFLALLICGALHAGAQEPAPNTYRSVQTGEQCIALTFDDGPSAIWTPQLLKLLASRQVKATFFMTGANVQAHPEMVKMEAAQGHEIGSRSWENASQKLKDDQFLPQLQKADNAIKTVIGRSPVLLRPPMGALDPSQAKWVNDKLGYQIILGNIDAVEMKEPTPAALAAAVVAKAQAGSIIIASDTHSALVQAMPLVIDGLQAKGYKFVTVSELLAMQGSNPEPEKTVPSRGDKPSRSNSRPTNSPYGTSLPPVSVITTR